MAAPKRVGAGQSVFDSSVTKSKARVRYEDGTTSVIDASKGGRAQPKSTHGIGSAALSAKPDLASSMKKMLTKGRGK